MRTNTECLQIASHQELKEFSASMDIIYIIDARLQLCGFNESWESFAKENGGEELLKKGVLDTSITDHISGSLKKYYERLYEAIFSNMKATSFNYECSSDEKYREFRQFVYPTSNQKGLVLMNHLIIETAHEGEDQEAAVKRFRSPQGLITQCSNCRKIRDSEDENKWYWVPALVRNPAQYVSHSICIPCVRYYYEEYLN